MIKFFSSTFFVNYRKDELKKSEFRKKSNGIDIILT